MLGLYTRDFTVTFLESKANKKILTKRIVSMDSAYPNVYALHAQCLWPYLLLVIGNDASDKMWICISERGHETSKLFLVELSHCPEHSLLRSNSEGRLIHLRRSDTREFR